MTPALWWIVAVLVVGFVAVLASMNDRISRLERRVNETPANDWRWPDEAQLGLVSVKPLAGEGVPPRTVCHYCGETGGHTGQCPVVSIGGAS